MCYCLLKNIFVQKSIFWSPSSNNEFIQLDWIGCAGWTRGKGLEGCKGTTCTVNTVKISSLSILVNEIGTIAIFNINVKNLPHFSLLDNVGSLFLV